MAFSGRPLSLRDVPLSVVRVSAWLGGWCPVLHGPAQLSAHLLKGTSLAPTLDIFQRFSGLSQTGPPTVGCGPHWLPSSGTWSPHHSLHGHEPQQSCDLWAPSGLRPPELACMECPSEKPNYISVPNLSNFSGQKFSSHHNWDRVGTISPTFRMKKTWLLSTITSVSIPFFFF